MTTEDTTAYVIERVPWPDHQSSTTPAPAATRSPMLSALGSAYHAGSPPWKAGMSRTRFMGNCWPSLPPQRSGRGGFPASQVIFDALAMGSYWLSVQEFNQMAGGQEPDFHDLGRVVILADPEPYSRETRGRRGDRDQAP